MEIARTTIFWMKDFVEKLNITANRVKIKAIIGRDEDDPMDIEYYRVKLKCDWNINKHAKIVAYNYDDKVVCATMYRNNIDLAIEELNEQFSKIQVNENMARQGKQPYYLNLGAKS